MLFVLKLKIKDVIKIMGIIKIILEEIVNDAISVKFFLLFVICIRISWSNPCPIIDAGIPAKEKIKLIRPIASKEYSLDNQFKKEILTKDVNNWINAKKKMNF